MTIGKTPTINSRNREKYLCVYTLINAIRHTKNNTQPDSFRSRGVKLFDSVASVKSESKILIFVLRIAIDTTMNHI